MPGRSAAHTIAHAHFQPPTLCSSADSSTTQASGSSLSSDHISTRSKLASRLTSASLASSDFSSSSTTYGDPEYLPVDENHPVGNCTRDSIQWEKWLEEAFADGDLSRDRLDFFGQFCSIEFLVRAAPMA